MAREIQPVELDLNGQQIHNPRAPVASDDVVRKQDLDAETTARLAAEALIPGTITALTGDVGASGTGSVPASLLNLPQAVLLARLAALTTDPAFNARKLTAIADGTNPQDAVAFHQLGDALAAQAFTVANATDLVAASAGDGAIRFVSIYRDFFRLDKSGTSRTVVPHMVLQSTVNAAWWWVRLCIPDPYWATQYQSVGCWIDPAGTNSTPGSDDADGLSSSAPLKSIAEWRRRVRGARFTSNVVIHALSGSSVTDDGLFDGFSCDTLTVFVVILGTPTPIGVSGTVASYQPYSGNTRGSFTDASITGGSWTAADAISSSSGSRFVRKVGTGARPYAPLLKDMGSQTVQFGIVSNWDETDTTTVTTAETNFANGDSYEVVSLPTWPTIQALNGNVRQQCVDVLGFQNPVFRTTEDFHSLTHVLCGFVTQINIVSNGIGLRIYSSVFCNPAGISIVGFGYVFINCSFVNTLLQINEGAFDWNGQRSVFVACTFRLWHGVIAASLGEMRMFDFTATLIDLNHVAFANAAGAIVGSGNSGLLVSCVLQSRFRGASQITATTSASLPYGLNGTNYSAPAVDGGSGDAIYN